jgi:hypothetical protein
MRCALFWSGGKDSLLALDRAQQDGIEVSHRVNIQEGSSGRVRFHVGNTTAYRPLSQHEELGAKMNPWWDDVCYRRLAEPRNHRVPRASKLGT